MRHRRHRPMGFAIILTLFVLALVFVIGMALQAVTATQLQESTFWQNANRAYQYARAGISRGIAELLNDTNYATPGGGVTGNVGSGTYTFSITPDPNNATRPLRQWKIASTGGLDANRRTLTAWVEQDTFAKYAYFTNNEKTSGNTTLWLKTGDTLRGPTHTNGYFSIFGTPRFDSIVTSSNQGDNDYNGTARTYTQGGTTYADPAKFYRYYYNYATDYPTAVSGTNGYSFNGGAAGVDLPTNAEIQDLLHANADVVLNGNQTLVFNANGTITATDANDAISTLTIPSGGYVVWVDAGYVNVQGTVKGNVTIGTNNDINVTGNILYNDRNTDVLGLVGTSSVNVKVDPNVAANLEIDAVIMALGDAFKVINYNTGVPRGTLTIFGGVIQSYRGAVGTFNGSNGNLLTGYNKVYGYDPKLVTNPPVNFPTTGQLVIRTWSDNNTL